MQFQVIKIISTWFFIGTLFFISCKKGESSGGSQVEQYFETNVLNKDFIINYASENGTDLTANYIDYTFRLLKTDFYHGALEARKNSILVTGTCTWSSNEDYSKLIITLPNTPSELIFLTREWRFTKKRPEQLELAPWGSTAPLVLYMKRQ